MVTRLVCMVVLLAALGGLPRGAVFAAPGPGELFTAIEANDLGEVRRLLLEGARADMKNKAGKTATERALALGHFAIAQALLAHRAPPGPPPLPEKNDGPALAESQVAGPPTVDAPPAEGPRAPIVSGETAESIGPRGFEVTVPPADEPLAERRAEDRLPDIAPRSAPKTAQSRPDQPPRPGPDDDRRRSGDLIDATPEDRLAILDDLLARTPERDPDAILAEGRRAAIEGRRSVDPSPPQPRVGLTIDDLKGETGTPTEPSLPEGRPGAPSTAPPPPPGVDLPRPGTAAEAPASDPARLPPLPGSPAANTAEGGGIPSHRFRLDVNGRPVLPTAWTAPVVLPGQAPPDDEVNVALLDENEVPFQSQFTRFLKGADLLKDTGTLWPVKRIRLGAGEQDSKDASEEELPPPERGTAPDPTAFATTVISGDGTARQDLPLTLGLSAALDTVTVPGVEQTNVCVPKARRDATFCILPLSWPASLDPFFKVTTILYSGTAAVVRFDGGRATRMQTLFETGAFDNVADWFVRRFGPPDRRVNRSVSPFGQPRRENPTLIWTTTDSATGEQTILEMRTFDDTRDGFPDVANGTLLLYRKGARQIFPDVSVHELLRLKRTG